MCRKWLLLALVLAGLLVWPVVGILSPLSSETP